MKRIYGGYKSPKARCTETQKKYKPENVLILQIQSFLQDMYAQLPIKRFWKFGEAMKDKYNSEFSDLINFQLEHVQHVSFTHAINETGESMRSIHEFCSCSDDLHQVTQRKPVRLLFRGDSFLVFASGFGHMHSNGLLYLHPAECTLYCAGEIEIPTSLFSNVKTIDLSCQDFLLGFYFIFNLDHFDTKEDAKEDCNGLTKIAHTAEIFSLLYLSLLGLFLLHHGNRDQIRLADISPFALLLSNAQQVSIKNTIPDHMKFNCIYLSFFDLYCFVFPKDLPLSYMLFKCSQFVSKICNNVCNYPEKLLSGQYSLSAKRLDLHSQEWENVDIKNVDILIDQSLRFEPHPFVTVSIDLDGVRSKQFVPDGSIEDYIPLTWIRSITCSSRGFAFTSLTSLTKNHTFLDLRARILTRLLVTDERACDMMFFLVENVVETVVENSMQCLQMQIKQIQVNNIVNKSTWSGRLYLDNRINEGWWEGSISLKSIDLRWKGVSLPKEIFSMNVNDLFPSRSEVFAWFHSFYVPDTMTMRLAEQCLITCVPVNDIQRFALLLSNVLCYQSSQVKRTKIEENIRVSSTLLTKFARSDCHFSHDVHFTNLPIDLIAHAENAKCPFRLFLNGCILPLMEAIRQGYGTRVAVKNYLF